MSSLLKEAIVVKTVAVQPRTDSNPSKEKAEMINVIRMKSPISLFDDVNRLVVKRAAASRPKKAAVQCPNNMKWQEINDTETIKQTTILVLSLNWKERISKQIAIPMRIWDKTKLDINSLPLVKC